MSYTTLANLVNAAGQFLGTLANPLIVQVQPLLASVHSISIGPNATNGASRQFFRNLAATPQPIKASAGVLYGLTISNSAATAAYIQLFDTTGTPTLGQSMANEIYVPPTTTLQLSFGLYGVQYTTGLVIAASLNEGGTTGAGSGLLVAAQYS